MRKNTKQQVAFTVCINDTNILFAIVNNDFHVLKEVYREIEISQNPDLVIALIKKELTDLSGEIASNFKIRGLGIAFPGIVDIRNGSIGYSFGYGWDNIELKALIENDLFIETIVESSGNATAIGEINAIAEKPKNIIGLFIGKTVQGSILLNRVPHKGSWGGAGQLGHLIISQDQNYPCRCGKYGHLEAYVSEDSIYKRIKSLQKKISVNKIPGRDHRDSGEMPLQGFYEAVISADALANKVMEDISFFIVEALSRVLVLFSPDLVILGGSVVEETGDILVNLVHKKLNQLEPKVYSYQQLHPSGIPVVRARMGKMACSIGLASLVFSESHTPK